MKRRLLITLLLFITPLQAEEQEQSSRQQAESSATTTEATAKEEAEPAPEAGNLRARELGEAFRNFQPSEEISADNAVSFPVDI
ncbi:MAG: hypothetical protein JJ921_01775 [Pseudomonadales bacterium]|nr:hypothetical protein [Pseudomonadales bacterium]MBO7005115.1 hypothetical protein [Pseudomonadales bacterium]